MSKTFLFQCQFQKKHFKHLLGIDSKTLSATVFYDKCDAYNKGNGKGITISDCTPSRNHNRTMVNEKGNSSFPITLLPRCIDEFVTKKYKIVFVLQKEIAELKYKNVLVEVKKGLFSEVCNEFPDEIKNICEI